MTQILSIFSNIILPILFISTTGYVLQKLIKFDPAVFTKIIFYILAPCLIFSRLYRTVLSFREFALVVIFVLTIILVLGLLSYLVSLLRKFPPSMRPAFALSIMFYNSANYGLPVVELVFAQNPVATSVQVMVLTVQNLVNMTLGIFLVSKGRAGFKKSLWRRMRYPMIYAVRFLLI